MLCGLGLLIFKQGGEERITPKKVFNGLTVKLKVRTFYFKQCVRFKKNWRRDSQ